MKKILALMVALILTFTMAGACAEGTAVEFFQQKPEEGPQKAYQAVIDAFVAANPDYAIEMNTVPDAGTVLVQRMSTGDIPAIFSDYPTQVQFQDKVDNGYVLCLSDYEFMSRVNEGYLEISVADDGKYYSLPISSNYMAIFYNIDIFNECGITELPTTWDELVAVCDTCLLYTSKAIDDDGNGRRDALISAAGGDDDGHVATAHACFGSRRCEGAHPGKDAVRRSLAKHSSDGNAILAGHAFVGDVPVHMHDAIIERGDLFQSHQIGKVLDVLQVQRGAVGKRALRGFTVVGEQDVVVFLNPGDVHVAVANFDQRAVAAGAAFDHKVQRDLRVQKFDAAVAGFNERSGPANVLGRHRFQHFHILIRVSAKRPQHGGRLNADHAVGMGDLYAADVLDDVAAALGQDGFGLCTENFSHFCRSIGEGDRFCTAHGGDQFFAEDIEKVAFNLTIQCGFLPCFKSPS